MSNENDILKRILLNMRYDSSMTLNENYNSVLNEDDFNLFGKKKKKPYATELNDKEYYSQSFVTYKTVVPNKTITVPDVRFKDQSGIKYRENILEPITWHDNTLPYNEENANRLFAKKCSTIEYYIDKNYNQCQTYTIYTKEISSGKNLELYVKSPIEKYKYKKEYFSNSNIVKYYYVTKKGWTEATGEYREKLKGWDLNEKIFDGAGTNKTQIVPVDQQNCTKLDQETCVKWSWNSLTIYGGINKGLKRFKLYSDYEKAKAGEGIVYSACVGIPKDSEETYPWFTQYVGFYDESKFVKTEDPNQPWKCPENAITTLPTIPTFSYGNQKYNKSISNDEEKEKYVNQTGENYMKGQQEKGYEYSWFSTDETDIENQNKMREDNKKKLESVISGGIRIKGK
jgi:hypothetical protein